MYDLANSFQAVDREQLRDQRGRYAGVAITLPLPVFVRTSGQASALPPTCETLHWPCRIAAGATEIAIPQRRSVVNFSMSMLTVDSGCRMRLTGELDLASTARFRDGITQAITGGTAHLTVDLAELVFIDSTGIRELVRARAQADSAGVAYRIVGARGQVAEVLDLVGVSDYLRGDGELR
jgi:anti-anti-sigma factor